MSKKKKVKWYSRFVLSYVVSLTCERRMADNPGSTSISKVVPIVSIVTHLYVSSSSTMCGCLSMWQMVASLLRSSRLRPGEAVNLATSTILTANSSPVCRCMHRRTSEKGPLPVNGRGGKGGEVSSQMSRRHLMYCIMLSELHLFLLVSANTITFLFIRIKSLLSLVLLLYPPPSEYKTSSCSLYVLRNRVSSSLSLV